MQKQRKKKEEERYKELENRSKEDREREIKRHNEKYSDKNQTYLHLKINSYHISSYSFCKRFMGVMLLLALVFFFFCLDAFIFFLYI
jgi:hypothetical protein